MPRRSILSASERESLLALPGTQEDLVRRYTLNESDMAVVRQRRGAANRLGVKKTTVLNVLTTFGGEYLVFHEALKQPSLQRTSCLVDKNIFAMLAV